MEKLFKTVFIKRSNKASNGDILLDKVGNRLIICPDERTCNVESSSYELRYLYIISSDAEPVNDTGYPIICQYNGKHVLGIISEIFDTAYKVEFLDKTFYQEEKQQYQGILKSVCRRVIASNDPTLFEHVASIPTHFIRSFVIESNKKPSRIFANVSLENDGFSPVVNDDLTVKITGYGIDL